jgi:tetratricopeptide (TPR) repeat protein
VLAVDPGNLRAASRLAVISFEAEDWDRAARLLRQLVESDVEPENLHECYYRLGFSTEKLGDEESAFSFYVKSFGREPMYLPTLDRLFELCYARRQWENTLRIATAIVGKYHDRKSPAELAELHLRIGLCELQLAERDIAVAKLQDMVLEPGEVPSAPDEAWLDVAESWAATALNPHLLGRVPVETMSRAVRSMERALTNVPEHIGALQVLAALSLSVGEWERSLRYIERAVATATLVPRRSAGLLCCAGDLAHHCLSARDRAENYYRQALAIDPGHGRAMQHLGRLLDVSQPAVQPRVPERALRSAPPPVPPSPLRQGRPPFRPAPRSKPRKPEGDDS